MPDPAYRPRGGAHLRESLYCEEGGQRLPPEAPALSAQRPAGEQDRARRRRGPHLRRDARGLRRGRRDRGPRASGPAALLDPPARGPCRRPAGTPPDRPRPAPPAPAPPARPPADTPPPPDHPFRPP